MRVLITGAAGFVGSYLIRHLLDLEPETEIVGVVQPGLPHEVLEDSRLRYVSCDIAAGHGEDLRALVQECRPDRVYHLAGAASGAAVDRDAVFRVNVEGTRHVLQAAAGIVPPGRVLFASTGYVYGPCDPARPARENDSLPETPYGIYAASKQAAEEVVRACGGAVIARAFNHTGPGQTAAFAVPAFASQIVRVEQGRQSEIRVGNMEATRDFLDVRDVVRAYHLLIEQGTAGEIYNVSSGTAISMSAILNDLCSLALRPITITSDPARMRPSDIPASVGDASKLMVLTGWAPEIPLAQTLQETLAWWRQRPVLAT